MRTRYIAARAMEAKRELAIRMQFLLYLAISSIAALVNLLVGFSLYALLGLSAGSLYALSVAIGYLAGMAVNWSLNRVFTFPSFRTPQASGIPHVSRSRVDRIAADGSPRCGFSEYLGPLHCRACRPRGMVTRSIG